MTKKSVANIALVGNPNVGKSSIFNMLTKKRQHTGNWTGKTVDSAAASIVEGDRSYNIVDLPGLYSFFDMSSEEEITKDYLLKGKADVVIAVIDATALERNLILFFSLKQMFSRVIVCLNLMDEAQKQQIRIDVNKLEELLGVRVIPCSARNKGQVFSLLRAVDDSLEQENIVISKNNFYSHEDIVLTAERVASLVITQSCRRARRIDRILTSRIFGIPIMLMFLSFIFFLSIRLSNYPGDLLAKLFAYMEKGISLFLVRINLSPAIRSLLVDGIYKTTAWVVAVMLPPMAIFFPLFAFFEELGYLPRIAFNLDKPFKRCGCNGKQCLTMCMGLGCNVVGVTGSRIIDSKKERLIAICTNSFMPCNGRFPTLITLSSIFIARGVTNSFASSMLQAFVLCVIIVFCVFMTFLVSFVLSRILKGERVAFCLELPPFRRPHIRAVIVNSLLNKTLLVLKRAMLVAAISGVVIWVLSFIIINDNTVLFYICRFLHPFAQRMGMDGNTLTAFLLSFPANEILLPLVAMTYTSSTSLADTSSLGSLLFANNWSIKTAISVMIFTVFHSPCANTIMAIFKETKSKRWTLFSMALPIMIGIGLCLIVGLF